MPMYVQWWNAALDHKLLDYQLNQKLRSPLTSTPSLAMDPVNLV